MESFFRLCYTCPGTLDIWLSCAFPLFILKFLFVRKILIFLRGPAEPGVRKLLGMSLGKTAN